METIEIELDEKILLALALMAHEKNITLNELVNNIIREQLKKEGYDV